MTTATATAERRSPKYKGPRKPVMARLPLDLAAVLERDASTAGVSVSEHVTALLAGLYSEEGARIT